jgi:hypothetical protein
VVLSTRGYGCCLAIRNEDTVRAELNCSATETVDAVPDRPYGRNVAPLLRHAQRVDLLEVGRMTGSDA